MGETRSYLKVEFENGRGAKIGGIIGEAVLDELTEFNNEYHKIRSDTYIPIQNRVRCLFENYFLIEEFFGLSSVNDFETALGWNEIEKESNFDFKCEGNILYLFNEIWHFLNWNSICHLFGQLGAIKISYISDEFGCIDMYKSNITPLKEEKLKGIVFEILL
jgi:hypothetical protein